MSVIDRHTHTHTIHFIIYSKKDTVTNLLDDDSTKDQWGMEQVVSSSTEEQTEKNLFSV